MMNALEFMNTLPSRPGMPQTGAHLPRSFRRLYTLGLPFPSFHAPNSQAFLSGARDSPFQIR
jgi:hypothetical protein